jgi:hypothetical protein
MSITAAEYEAKLRGVLVARLAAAGAMCVTELKHVLSVPAPTRVAKSGRRYATTPATPGAPPRKVTGIGRAAVTFLIDPAALACRVGLKLHYMRKHELDETHPHKWLYPTLARLSPRIAAKLAGK